MAWTTYYKVAGICMFVGVSVCLYHTQNIGVQLKSRIFQIIKMLVKLKSFSDNYKLQKTELKFLD